MNFGGDMRKLRVIGNKILVRKKEIERKSPGGIIFIDSAEKHLNYFQGEVIGLGEGNYINGHLFPFEISIGDKILFVQHGVVELDYIENETLYIIKEPDIIAKIDENDELIPLGDLLMCKRAEKLKESDGGIIFSMNGVEQDKALVLKKGKGRYTMNGKYDDYGIQVDEAVFFASNRGLNITWKHEEYIFLGMTTILGTADKDTDIEKMNDLFTGEL